MGNIVLLFACLVIGMVLRKSGRMPENGHAAFNAFIINISLPALTLLQIHRIALAPELLCSVAMPWLLFAIGGVFFWVLSKAMKFSAATTGALILSGGLANTSFVGLPMIETFYGRNEMGIGILIDQLGTYLVLSTLGIAVASIYSAGANSAREIIKRVFTFPPLLALLLALALLHVHYPPWFSETLRRLGDTLSPLALVSVGMQLRLDQFRGNSSPLALGLSFKLLLAPLLLAILYVGVLRMTGEVTRVTVFESAMGPMIGGAIVAIQHGLNPPLITLMVGVGITLSFLTLPMWWYALQMY
jgi:malate permease and related proteins